MREEVIEILCMICPTIDVEDEDLNIFDYLDSEDVKTLMEELEDKFDIEITADERAEENFENLDTIIEMIERIQ